MKSETVYVLISRNGEISAGACVKLDNIDGKLTLAMIRNAVKLVFPFLQSTDGLVRIYDEDDFRETITLYNVRVFQSKRTLFKVQDFLPRGH